MENVIASGNFWGEFLQHPPEKVPVIFLIFAYNPNNQMERKKAWISSQPNRTGARTGSYNARQVSRAHKKLQFIQLRYHLAVSSSLKAIPRPFEE